MTCDSHESSETFGISTYSSPFEYSAVSKVTAQHFLCLSPDAVIPSLSFVCHHTWPEQTLRGCTFTECLAHSTPSFVADPCTHWKWRNIPNSGIEVFPSLKPGSKTSPLTIAGSGIAPFFPVPTLASGFHLPFHVFLFLVRLPLLISATLAYFFVLQWLPIGSLGKKASLWVILGIPGIWWIDLQIDGVRRGYDTSHLFLIQTAC